MIEFIFLIVMVVHLLSVNVASAGPLILVWLDWQHSRDDELARTAARRLNAVSLHGLLAGAATGLLLGWLSWSPAFRQALHRLEYKLAWGVGELAFSLVLLVLLGGWWKRERQPTGFARVVRAGVAFLAATNLLYHFPLLLGVLAKIAATESNGPPIRAAEFRGLMADGLLLAQSTHVILASVAVAGVTLIAFAWRGGVADADRERLAKWGGRWALFPTVAQIPVGLWIVTSLPQDAQDRMMDSVPSLVAFGMGIFLALSLMHVLSAIAFGDPRRELWRRAVTLTLTVVSLMTAVQRWTRPTATPPVQEAHFERTD